jgi:hypothetical protein
MHFHFQSYTSNNSKIKIKVLKNVKKAIFLKEVLQTLWKKSLTEDIAEGMLI